MRKTVIYLTNSVDRDLKRYINGEFLKDYSREIYKIWFIDKNQARKQQTEILERSQTILVKKASA